MKKETWFEVFITYDDEGTETIASFDTEEEAIDYIESLNLSYDEWTFDDVGMPELV